MGGTWDLFRYPGVRSDSDMHTLGYSFKPWKHQSAIADGQAILTYIRETAQEYDVEQHIRYNQRVTKIAWDSGTATWTLRIEQEGKRASKITCNFIYSCTGYYRYDKGYTPEFPGSDQFKGQLVHPQQWPEDLDYAGKKVVVIGSGATAITLVPSMAKTAAHVTMLQRSPTYVLTRPSEDWFANGLRKILPASWAYAITRARNVLFQEVLFKMSQAFPKAAKSFFIGEVRKKLGKDYDVDKHFTPKYFPWDQRLCLVPDEDMFNAINSGGANVVTEHIKRFTKNGIELETGEHLEADIIVSATGLRLLVMGGATFTVDGEAIDFSSKTTYKGLMVSDVPNMVSVFGYINASWTLRADLAAEWICRSLNHMSGTQTTKMVPLVPESLKDMPTKDWIADFPAGYMQRSMHLQPRQGDQAPWVNSQNFRKERALFGKPIESDGALHFTAVPNG